MIQKYSYVLYNDFGSNLSIDYSFHLKFILLYGSQTVYMVP